MSILRVREPETGEVKEVLCLRGENGKDGIDGVDGKDGVNGEDGYTPQKGVDYFTEEDIATVVDAVYDKVANGNGVAY